jgi:hypothetical protein
MTHGMFHLLNQPSPVSFQNRVTATRRAIILAVLVIGALLAYGMLRFPAVLAVSSTGVRGLVGVLGILMVYAAVGWFGPSFTERIHPQILRAGLLGGLLIGCVFVAEMLLEYWLLPDDNTAMGLVEYGLVFAVFFLVGLGVAYQTGAVRNGVLAAVWSAIVGGLIWYGAALLIFYLFSGTPQQAQVFRAEGNYADFSRSGLNDLNAFVMEDFMGAGFFHSLLLPIIAAILGTLGATTGKVLARLRKA